MERIRNQKCTGGPRACHDMRRARHNLHVVDDVAIVLHIFATSGGMV